MTSGGNGLFFIEIFSTYFSDLIEFLEKPNVEIRIFDNNGELLNSWFAYKTDWKNLGVHVAAGDINGDGEIEIIAGAGIGGGPHVKIFDKGGKILISEFFADDKNLRGGIYLAAGDINGDQIDEIITGAGQGSQPQIKVFNWQGALISQWLPYNSGRNGLEVAAADFNNDGVDEIVALTTDVFTLSFSK